MELKTTKDRVLEAAKNCPQAEQTLKTLFPEVFADDKHFDLSKLVSDLKHGAYIFSHKSSVEAGFEGSAFLQIRMSGEFINKAFYLGSEYNWVIKRDSRGVLCLIPTKK